MRAPPMSMRPCIRGRRPDVSGIRKRLPSMTASPRSRARPAAEVDSTSAPVRSSDPSMRAPISRISPRARNWCSSRMVPLMCIRSAWMERPPSASITVSTHSNRPPMSDSQSHTAARCDVLALVLYAPLTWVPERSRSRRTRIPFASRPGRGSHCVTASSYSWAPSASSGASNPQLSNRSGNGTSRPERSSDPTTATFRSLPMYAHELGENELTVSVTQQHTG